VSMAAAPGLGARPAGEEQGLLCMVDILQGLLSWESGQGPNPSGKGLGSHRD
jgi:hypothetical protein